ncbi:unnamed protein product, partial [Heterosigma akashiwo]
EKKAKAGKGKNKNKKRKLNDEKVMCNDHGDGANRSNGTNHTVSPTEYREKHEISSVGERDLPDPIQSFEDAPFDASVKAALKRAGFSSPSPIQAQGWPAVLEGNDLVAVAKTGSGKTLGFLLPVIHQILQQGDRNKGPGPQALVLAPTRELAVQIKAECDRACAGLEVKAGGVCAVVYGGAPKGPQVAALKKAPLVVVATPGRLVDLMDGGSATVGRVAHLVMDEADRMLDMGFEPQIKKIVGALPAARQTLFFTATWQKSVEKMAGKYLRSGADLTHITVGSTEELAANRAITQEFHEADDSEKDALLVRVVEALPEGSKVLTFANTKRRAEALARDWWRCGYGANALHGDKAQAEREAALAARRRRGAAVFATTYAAPPDAGVTHVVNYDMPRDVEQYVHRIGRTARGTAAEGASITFVNRAYDLPCSPALVKIAEEAGQAPPQWLRDMAERAKGLKGKQLKNWKY